MSTQNPAVSAFSTRQMIVALYTAAVAFFTYACIFAYRKAFTVATFEGLVFWGIKYQTLLIISQGLGYMASKFYGIRFISELKRLGRWKTSALLIGAAWLCLLLFAVDAGALGNVVAVWQWLYAWLYVGYYFQLCRRTTGNGFYWSCYGGKFCICRWFQPVDSCLVAR